MSEERDDVAVDEALATVRATLAIVPSAALEVRVRERIAQARPLRVRPAWHLWAAAAALIVAAGTVWTLRPDERARRAADATPVAPVAPPPTPLVHAETASPEAASQPTRTARAHPRPTGRRSSPPVRDGFVPAGEVVRAARYVALTRRHPFVADALPAADPQAPLREPAPLAVRPLDVPPIVLEEGSLR